MTPYEDEKKYLIMYDVRPGISLIASHFHWSRETIESLELDDFLYYWEIAKRSDEAIGKAVEEVQKYGKK